MVPTGPRPDYQLGPKEGPYQIPCARSFGWVIRGLLTSVVGCIIYYRHLGHIQKQLWILQLCFGQMMRTDGAHISTENIVGPTIPPWTSISSKAWILAVGFLWHNCRKFSHPTLDLHICGELLFLWKCRCTYKPLMSASLNKPSSWHLTLFFSLVSVRIFIIIWIFCSMGVVFFFSLS